MVHGLTETEVKIRVPDQSAIRQALQVSGYREFMPRAFESNTLYDTPARTLQQGGTMLRLRQAGEKAMITWKGQKVSGPHKSRPELETSVGSHDVLHAILAEIGFEPTFRYEKYRTEYQDADANGLVTVDETPVGCFMELEGDGVWIDSTARVLGFSETDYILDSYAKLYLSDCEKRQVEPRNMVFASGE